MDLIKAEEQFKAQAYKEALQTIGEADSKDALQLKAYCHQKLQQFDLAMECWNLLIQREPENAQYYNERGVCKFNLHFKHALEDFDKAVELSEDPYFYACRAYVKDKIGDSEGAVADYQKAHELDPEDAITLNNLGLAEQKLGHTANARKFFAKSNELLGLDLDEGADEPQNTVTYNPSFSEKWKEVRKMLSSTKEFKRFLKEVLGKS